MRRHRSSCGRHCARALVAAIAAVATIGTVQASAGEETYEGFGRILEVTKDIASTDGKAQTRGLWLPAGADSLPVVFVAAEDVEIEELTNSMVQVTGTVQIGVGGERRLKLGDVQEFKVGTGLRSAVQVLNDRTRALGELETRALEMPIGERAVMLESLQRARNAKLQSSAQLHDSVRRLQDKLAGFTMATEQQDGVLPLDELEHVLDALAQHEEVGADLHQEGLAWMERGSPLLDPAGPTPGRMLVQFADSFQPEANSIFEAVVEAAQEAVAVGEIVPKARYRSEHRLTYRDAARMADAFRAIVQIRAPHGLVGTGVFVGPQYVLTARHVLHPVEASGRLGHRTEATIKAELSVRSETIAPDGVERIEVLRIEDVWQSVDYDWALLQIVEPTGTAAAPPGAERKVVPLAPRVLTQGDPLYLFGGSSGATLLAGRDVRVLFPPSVDAAAFAKLVESEASRLVMQLLEGGLPASDAAPLAALKRAYAKRLVDARRAIEHLYGTGAYPRAYFCNLLGRRLPVLGCDAYLEQGDSGGPAFSQKEHSLIGLVAGGAPDDSNLPSAAPHTHEVVLSLSGIVGEMKRMLPEPVRTAIGL